jgi:hypothetical protein
MHLAFAPRSPALLLRATPHARSGSRTREFLLPALLRALLLGFAPLSVAHAEVGFGGCPVTNAIGVDSLAATGSRMLSTGRGLAQTFTPKDSLIRSVAIWTPAFQRNSSSRIHLWITRVTSDGRPDLDAVIADGGRLADLGRDPARARYQAEFVPPISLPRQSRYALVVVAEGCGVLGVLTARSARAGDALWETSLRGCSSAAEATRQRLSDESLVFRVEFCDVGTMAHGRTWGDIKTLYR